MTARHECVVEQLQFAQQAADGNFYEQSAVDARLRELRQLRVEDEKMRRLIEQLKNRADLPNAWHELASRGDAAIPMLLESLERRELEIRHVAFKLLESITGQTHDYQSDAAEDVRLRQVAHLRAKLEKRA